MSIAPTIHLQADANAAAQAMHAFVSPVVRSMCVLASLVCVFFIVNSAYAYMTSAGKVEQLDHAKRILKNALIGLVIVLSAGVLTAILTHAYGNPSAAHTAVLPKLQAVPPDSVSNGLVAVLIKAITGLLNNIIQAVAEPILKALSFFTSSTELMANNGPVFNLWLTMVGITDVLFVLVVALLGFHVMGASTFGFDEIEFKHLVPRIGLVFLGINASIFIIDGVIELSNAMIHAVNLAGGVGSVWLVLTAVAKESGGKGVASLLLMIAFLIFAIILLVYYVGRLITLYIGAVLSPVVLLAWLIPGFRDFSETAAKTYLTTIFVLFVHVVILQLAASLFAGMAIGSGASLSNDLMSMITGLATVIALLKTQGVMQQFSYMSLGPRNMRKLGGQFVNGISYMGSRSKTMTTAAGTAAKRNIGSSGGSSYTRKPRSSQGQTVLATSTYKPPTAKATKAKTGTTTVAPQSTQPHSKPIDPTKSVKKQKDAL